MNVDGTRRDARVRPALRAARALHLRLHRLRGRRARRRSSARTSSTVGQSFRNPYERSKFEAELALRERGAPTCRSRYCGRASSSATAPPAAPPRSTCSTARSRRSPAAGSARSRRAATRPWTSCPVDYVADRVHELATDGPDGTFHLVAGRNATTVGRLLELSSRELRPQAAHRPAAAPVPALGAPLAAPASTAGCVAWRSTSLTSRCGCASTTAASGRARGWSATSTGSSRYAQEAGWGRR